MFHFLLPSQLNSVGRKEVQIWVLRRQGKRKKNARQLKLQRFKPGLHLHVLGPSSHVPPTELQLTQGPVYVVHCPSGPQLVSHSQTSGRWVHLPCGQVTLHSLIVSQCRPDYEREKMKGSKHEATEVASVKEPPKKILVYFKKTI